MPAISLFYFLSMTLHGLVWNTIHPGKHKHKWLLSIIQTIVRHKYEWLLFIHISDSQLTSYSSYCHEMCGRDTLNPLFILISNNTPDNFCDELSSSFIWYHFLNSPLFFYCINSHARPPWCPIERRLPKLHSQIPQRISRLWISSFESHWSPCCIWTF